jgi:hypothetical protein
MDAAMISNQTNFKTIVKNLIRPGIFMCNPQKGEIFVADQQMVNCDSVLQFEVF